MEDKRTESYLKRATEKAEARGDIKKSSYYTSPKSENINSVAGVKASYSSETIEKGAIK